MALQINDTTAIIRRITNLIQGNSDWCMGVWIQASYMPLGPNYLTCISKQNVGYSAWAGIYSSNLGPVFDNPFEINVDNGGGASDTADAVIETNLAHLGYRKEGANHLFYRDGTLIGNVVEDMSAVTFFEMLLGNDRNNIILGPIKFFDFFEYNIAKSVNTILFQMGIIGRPV
ncbi:MAG: hypothetical protein EHM34_04740, partial [Nitrosopumilales archaeon]